MIVRNPVVKAALIVFCFWYVVAYAVYSVTHGWGGVEGLIWLATDLPFALLVIAVGYAMGATIALGTHWRTLLRRETAVKAGGVERGLKLSLGALPALDGPVKNDGKHGADAAAFLTALHARPWWKLMEAEFPVHSRAADAVAHAMALMPNLPASPVPGGHGGRTLFVHSLAVADTIVGMARTWRYTGQKDKRGRVRVKLRDTKGDYHAFSRKDLGLVLLAGFAHDFGKLVCYQLTGQVENGQKLVREILPNHDTEGAAALRLLPEVMALPYTDRRALLLAVGYYHHAGSIGDGAGITDRMRSLTELLICADMATGKMEGGTSSQSAYEDTYGEGDGLEAQPLLDEEVQSVGAEPRAVSEAGVSRSVRNETSHNSAPPKSQMDAEIHLLMRVLADPNSIGVRVQDKTKRIGWKFDGKLWLLDAAVKSQLAATAKLSEEDYAAEVLGIGSTEPRNGNASPISRRLLEQLHARGALKVDWNDGELSPQRAMWIVRDPKGKDVSGIFVVDASINARTQSLPDDGAMTILRPLWGAGSAHKAKAVELSPAPPLDRVTPAAPDRSVFMDDQVLGESFDPVANIQKVAGNASLPPGMEDDESAPVMMEPVSTFVDVDAGAMTLADAIAEFLTVTSSAVTFKANPTDPEEQLAILKRKDDPALFSAFVSLIDAAAQQGVDVAAVRFIAASDGTPGAAIFPAPRKVK